MPLLHSEGRLKFGAMKLEGVDGQLNQRNKLLWFKIWPRKVLRMTRFLNVVDWSDAKATFFVSLVAGASVPSHRDAGRDEADDGAGRRRAERVHQPGEHSASV